MNSNQDATQENMHKPTWNLVKILITGTIFFYFTLYRASNKMMVVYSVNSLTLHPKTDVAQFGYYPDFEPTSPCSYSIMMGA
jgi:hypothetical protein